jgi:hypothetical protein
MLSFLWQRWHHGKQSQSWQVFLSSETSLATAAEPPKQQKELYMGEVQSSSRTIFTAHSKDRSQCFQKKIK